MVIGKASATNMSAKGSVWWRSMKDETFYIGKMPGLHSQMSVQVISEKTGTLRASGIGGITVKEDEAMKIYECHAQDSRYNERTVSPTLGRKMGTGSGNVPLKVEKGVCLLQGTGMSRSGPVYKEKTSFTLTGVDRYCTVDDKAPQAVLKPSGYVVRRLTPLECERLQGLPDNYTAYGSDTARYKAIGNGMAQPCADFVLSKVVEMFEEADDET